MLYEAGLNTPMPIYALGNLIPNIHPDAFVHPDAVIIGNVKVGAESSIWPTTVLRGDSGLISIGRQTSIQDGSIIHCTEKHDTIIGDRCVVGHNAHMEGCTVEDDVLIGSGSVMLHRVLVKSRAIVAAGAVLKDDTLVPNNALAYGVPAKIREDAVENGVFDWNVEMYLKNAKLYNEKLRLINIEDCR
jgi:carbonic anhydrase/acetyltransferase-like protein (isoleucine patch superfamily)